MNSGKHRQLAHVAVHLAGRIEVAAGIRDHGDAAAAARDGRARDPRAVTDRERLALALVFDHRGLARRAHQLDALGRSFAGG